MVESLLELEIALSMQRKEVHGGDSGACKADLNYAKLRTRINAVGSEGGVSS